MVTLPQVDQYSPSEREALAGFSSVFDHYLHQLSRKSENFSQDIRKLKHHQWLTCVAATYFEKASPEELCYFWSLETQKIIEKVWTHCELDKEEVCLLAFGKLGSFELNLSSDIDVVFVKGNDANASVISNKVKKFIQILSENNSFGFAYRVDTNLRPGGASSPLVPSKSQFYNYFDEYTEAWNRLSFIRMRPLVGDKTLSSDLENYCKKLSFPRRLDFSIINEIKGIRSKINYQWHKAHEPLDIKLHPGGIRDIELLIHSLQVIYGGRHHSLQCLSITQAMKELRAIDALREEDYVFLNQFYWELRKIENFIHASNDKHSYHLNIENFKDIEPLAQPIEDLTDNLKRASDIVADFFSPAKRRVKSDQPAIDNLSPNSLKALDEIRNLKSHSLKKQKTEEAKSRILDKFVETTNKIAIDQDLAIQIFRDFIFAIRSKSSIFHLLDHHEELLENLAWLFSISPYVGQIICRRPELIDSFALGQVEVDSDDTEEFLENLIDYKLLGQLVAIIYLLKDQDVSTYCRKLTEQADFICQKLLKHVQQQTQAEPFDILCMGKWSGFELGIQSDLDIVFLTDSIPSTNQVKCARRIINLLSNTTRGGKLYNIDLRLKPNESAGPLILEKSKFHQFVEGQSEPWQKQAYLRSRLLGQETMYFKDHFSWLRLNRQQIQELDEIHQKIYLPTSDESFDIKLSWGGIAHTEFKIQKLCLLGKVAPDSPSTQSIIKSLPIQSDAKNQILKNYMLFRQFEQIFQVCNDSPRTKVAVTNSNLSRVGRILDRKQPFDEIKTFLTEQRELLKSLDLNH